MRFARLFVFALLVAAPTVLRAQDSIGPVYSAWMSAGWHAPIANNSRISLQRSLFVAGIERRFPLTSGRFGSLSWAPSVLPAVRTTNNLRLTAIACTGASAASRTATVVSVNKQCYRGDPYSAFGIGVLPLAFHWETAMQRRFALVSDLDGGGVLFDGRLPVTDGGHLSGTRFNFAARAGIDGVVRVTDRAWLSAGYRHLHLSNAGFGGINPGIDAPLAALGVAWR